MRNKLYIIRYRIAGVLSCLVDLCIQLVFSAAAMFRKDPELDETERFYHD